MKLLSGHDKMAMSSRNYKLESLRETLTLEYPSYVTALAMALEYPEGPFVHNALVFAPGKTIIESLRELAEAPLVEGRRAKLQVLSWIYSTTAV